MAMNNSLAEVHPELASEWSEKNLPLKPDEVNAKSRKNVWWKCRHDHSWSMKINERTILKKGCRICEQEYLSLFPALAVSYYSNKKGLKAELGRMATESGFVRDTFEKVLRLKEILKFLNEDKSLREHLLLKGGTAINLTVFNLPRLSVDIDMDYTPNDTREGMLECRAKITDIIKEYMESEGYQLSEASRFSHSLDAFHYNYQNAGGNRDMIKIELNYSLRAHIFEPVYSSILPSAFDDGLKIRMVNPLEIFAAKGNALITRAAARDLYDWCNMLSEGLFEEQRDLFRKCFLFYMTISADTLNKSFDTSAIDTLDFNKIRRDLFPVLNKKDNFQLDERKKIAKNYISDLMVLNTKEKEYIDRFEEKKYMPELLFEDAEIVERVKNHPMALWKCKE